MLTLQKIYRLKLKLVFFLAWCNIEIFIINHIWDIRNKSCLIWCSCMHVHEIFSWSKLCFTLVIYIFSSFFSVSKFFFSSTLRLSLNFNNIRKLKHVRTWKTLCKRYTFIKFIMRLQIIKCLVYSVRMNWLKIYMTPVFKTPFQFNHN